jgi:hypothetical protein
LIVSHGMVLNHLPTGPRYISPGFFLGMFSLSMEQQSLVILSNQPWHWGQVFLDNFEPRPCIISLWKPCIVCATSWSTDHLFFTLVGFVYFAGTLWLFNVAMENHHAINRKIIMNHQWAMVHSNVTNNQRVPSGNLLHNYFPNDHRNSEISHWKWWCSIAM